jgi:NADH:ubiquinone reductase (H+-translocating)
MDKKHRVVIVGGGFGGLYAAQSLKNATLEVTLIDRRNFHLFQPLLYQVATGWLSPANIASTLRAVLKRQRNARVLLGEVIDIDCDEQKVVLAAGKVEYDTLIVATGSRHHYFGHDHWESLAPGLKTVEDATEMRRRIFLAFEAAERESDPAEVRVLLTFIIVGGGPTGVELAGALADIARETLVQDFRRIDPTAAQILLIEAEDRILTAYPAELSKKAQSF